MGAKFEAVAEVSRLAEQHRYEEVRDFYRSDVRGWSPTYDFEGVETWLTLLAAQNDPFSDIETVQQMVVETDDLVVSEWTWVGTHSASIHGEGFELPATGKRISMKGMAVFEFIDGQIAVFRQYWDNAAVGAQFM